MKISNVFKLLLYTLTSPLICLFYMFGIMICGVPNFWKLMPSPANGKFLVTVWRRNPFRDVEMFQEKIDGRLRAYLTARWVALNVDMQTPIGGGWEEVGVMWSIMEIKS